MVISGGAGTLFGPVVGAALVVIMKNVASAYIVRWNFVLGAIFVAIVVFMPEGIVPGTARPVAPGVRRPAPAASHRSRGPAADERARDLRSGQILRRPAGYPSISLNVEPGERRLIIGPTAPARRRYST